MAKTGHKYRFMAFIAAVHTITVTSRRKLHIFTWVPGKFTPGSFVSTPTPLPVKLILLPLLATLASPAFLAGQPSPVDEQGRSQVASDVYSWNAFKPDKKENREKKEILQGRTKFLETLEIHTSTLEPNTTAGPAHAHDDLEELVIVKEGKLKVTQNDNTQILGPGSIALTLPATRPNWKTAVTHPLRTT